MIKSTIKPLNNCVLVKKVDEETKSGLLTGKKKFIVKSISPGFATAFDVGDEIIYVNAEWQDGEYAIVKKENVLGVIKGGD